MSLTTLQQSLMDRYHYDPLTGNFTNNINVARTGVTKGGIAGTLIGNGRRIISFGEKRHPIGNLIVLYMEGYLPAFSGYHDGDYKNFKYDNIFASDIKVINRCENKVNPRSEAGREKMQDIKIKILDFMDVKVGEFNIAEAGIGVGASIGSVEKKQIAKGVGGINTQRLDALLKQLVISRCIEYNRTTKAYHLLSRGRSRILDDGEDAAQKKLDLMLQFYGVMPNLVLPLNNVYGTGEVYFARY